jgi:hypothetical protein
VALHLAGQGVHLRLVVRQRNVFVGVRVGDVAEQVVQEVGDLGEVGLAGRG